MVQKSPKRRGRPRGYDPAVALARAMDVFWDAGYAAASLDDLSAATGMNRPSLYGAFGDKQALYLKTLGEYRAGGKLHAALTQDETLRASLHRVYTAAISIYLAGENGPRGCFLIGTALTASVLDPKVRATFFGALGEIDAEFEARIRRAQRDNELPRSANPPALARLAAAVLHTLAIRARAGAPRALLETIAADGIALICGPRSHARRRIAPQEPGDGSENRKGRRSR
jgi:AcrR family transcriptional regulator